MKEWVKAPSVGVVLPLTHLQNLVSFPRYGRLKKKCWYKQVCNGTYWLLLTAHFGPVFIRPSQWRITAVPSNSVVQVCDSQGKCASVYLGSGWIEFDKLGFQLLVDLVNRGIGVPVGLVAQVKLDAVVGELLVRGLGKRE